MWNAEGGRNWRGAGKRQLQANSQNTPAARNFLFALPTLVWNTVIYMKLLEKFPKAS